MDQASWEDRQGGTLGSRAAADGALERTQAPRLPALADGHARQRGVGMILDDRLHGHGYQPMGGRRVGPSRHGKTPAALIPLAAGAPSTRVCRLPARRVGALARGCRAGFAAPSGRLADLGQFGAVGVGFAFGSFGSRPQVCA